MKARVETPMHGVIPLCEYLRHCADLCDRHERALSASEITAIRKAVEWIEAQCSSRDYWTAIRTDNTSLMGLVRQLRDEVKTKNDLLLRFQKANDRAVAMLESAIAKAKALSHDAG